MDSSPQVTPAGKAGGHQKPQMGPLKALALSSFPLLREEPRAQGGLASPKALAPKEVHTLKEPLGKEQAVPDPLNPTKPNGESAHPESQFFKK